MRPDRLFVIWRHPADGKRYVIGDLIRQGGEYAFSYRAELPIDRGFALLPEFPEQRVTPREYRSRHLFPTFAQRIPSPVRPDFLALMYAWGVEHGDDPLEVLSRSGGVQLTDRLELAEYRADDDELEPPLDMRVAGATHYDAGGLKEGDALQLKREPANEHDPRATVFLFKGGKKIGYVPDQYASLVARLLDAGVHLEAKAIRCLALPAETGRWVVRVSRR